MEHGCQHCVLKVHHPDFPEPEPDADTEPDVVCMDVSKEIED